MWRALFVVMPLLALFILALIFGAHNKILVPVNFIVAQKEMTIASLLAIFLAIGFFFGVLSMTLSYWRERGRNRRLRKALAKHNTH